MFVIQSETQSCAGKNVFVLFPKMAMLVLSGVHCIFDAVGFNFKT